MGWALGRRDGLLIIGGGEAEVRNSWTDGLQRRFTCQIGDYNIQVIERQRISESMGVISGATDWLLLKSQIVSF